MSRDPDPDKRSDADRPLPPRMLGDTDVRVIMEQVEKLPQGARILEVGPWLGGLTRLLSQHGQVTVVDRFIWTDANNRNYPGIAEPEENFRAIFEQNMATDGIAPTIIEADMAQLEWSGEEIDLVVIDALVTAEELHACLCAIAGSLKPEAKLLIKNTFNTREFGPGAYFDALLGVGALEITASDQPQWCNIGNLTAKAGINDIGKWASADDLIAIAPMPQGFSDPWYGTTLSSFRLAHLALAGRWSDAFARLSEMPASSDNLAQWDVLEPIVWDRLAEENEGQFAALSELVWIRNDVTRAKRLPVEIGPSFADRLKAYWCNNDAAEWVHDGLETLSWIDDETSAHITSAVAAHGAKIYQSHVLEIGENLGGGALAAVLAGARTYFGIEMSTTTNLGDALKDRFPHISITDDMEMAKDDIGHPDVLIIGKGLVDGSALSDEIERLRRSRSKELLVINL